MPTLPDKLSELIFLALEDLAKVEASDNMQVNMDTWVKRTTYGTCQVCFAGAVMVKSLNSLEDGTETPSFFPVDIYNKLQALDCLRSGLVDEAAEKIGLRQNLLSCDRDICQYEKTLIYSKSK